jgi:holo-[acyl-carrier protein] synthase
MRIGSDIQSLAELREKMGLRGNRAVFSAYERAYCDKKRDALSSLGGILCAKEACIKALNGFEGLPRFGFRDLEIRHTTTGRPLLAAGGRLGTWLEARGIEVDVSISHSADYVMATVIADEPRREGGR